MENERDCKKLIEKKVELIKETTNIPEEIFNKILSHILLYCELGFNRKECWQDYLILLGIKSFKDPKYAEAKRVFNLIVKIISKYCGCFKTETTEQDWQQNSEW